MPIRVAVSCLALLVFLLGSQPVRADHRIEQRPDSLTSILNLDLDKGNLEELPGGEVREFSLSTSLERSSIVWRVGETYYIYYLNDRDHVRLGLDLLERLRTNGLFTFVARRDGGRLGQYAHVREVVAIQLRSVTLR